ncbi:MAG: 6-phosphofructokinase [Chloroflexi bacterium]|nr:6-phosphofructokinase [Chloroflexota bacterium]
MRIGVLTGGGDAPGLNAAIRAITRKAGHEGWEVLGFRNGWLGVLERDYIPLDRDTVKGILPRGGTILGTSRTNPYKRRGGPEKLLRNLERLGVDALTPIGGEDTLGVALRLSQQGVPLVGVPKTIDNDLFETDYTIGLSTAVETVSDALDRLHSTAEAHHRVMVLEVMGRHAGWIATLGGLAGGADLILTPEVPFVVEEVLLHIRRRHEELRRMFSVIVVAEGARPKELESSIVQEAGVDEFGHTRLGGIGEFIAHQIEKLMGYEARVTVLGHLQRGGSPSSFDRILATRLGAAAVDLVKEGTFGVMVALKSNRITSVPLEKALRGSRSVDLDLYQLAHYFY